MDAAERRAQAARAFSAEMVAVFERFDEICAGLPAPRSSERQIADADRLGLHSGSTLIDVGGWGGTWTRGLMDQFDCRAVLVDLAHAGLVEGVARGVPAVLGEAENLPFANSSVDVVWCRDMLSMVEDPAKVLREFSRVLRPGGGVMLYTALTTDALEPMERRSLLAGLNSPDWWGQGRRPVEEAISGANLLTISFEVHSPENSLWLLDNDPNEVVGQLRRAGQMRRYRDQIEPAIGPEWFTQFEAWNRWQAYLVLGKIETGVWLLKKPPA